ncbi:DUF11 domain-containing protein [Roseimaritima sediminicola]|uniref:DUF11 domain-containing protein n=1 Tax=Roseimaritima sediminicola TaxID=2662066 RepID=UPI0012984AFE|nr:DUF11 domain-containing protein [Roseimaritima sediminicola]
MTHLSFLKPVLGGLGGTLALLALCTAPLSAADSIQTGDGLLQVQAELPQEVRSGESFHYQVTVKNTSDNIVLHNVKLKQAKAKGLTIESVSMQQQNQKQNKKAAEEKGGGKQMTIKMLQPGESRTFQVKATADEEGELKSCLEVTSYTPALCLTSKVVKPQLELTKSAPDKVNRCEVIELRYTLKNGGTGDVGAIEVTDSLGSDLATIEGESDLKFNVDGLGAGDTREFVARVYAKKAGEFSSRAQAKAQDSDLSSRSKETTTKVVAADLAAQLSGPNRLYGDELARFDARVTNTGNVPAEDVEIEVMVPEGARLVNISDPEMKSGQSSQNGQSNQGNNNQNQPTPANDQKQNDQKQNDQKQNDQKQNDPQANMRAEMLTIDRLEAGQTVAFEYALRPNDLTEIPTKIKATYVCSVGPAEDQAKATAKATSTAMTTVKVVRLPAMQLMVIDDEDPVDKGDNVVYSIRVWNEGDAPDQNVRLTAELPDGLEFVSANGPTNQSQNGSTIEFEPVKEMAPGDRADFRVEAKSTGADSVRFTVNLTSDLLNEKVTAEEPTRLFQR